MQQQIGHDLAIKVGIVIILIGTLAFVVFEIVLLFYNRRQNRRRSSVLKSRPLMTEAQWYEKFYSPTNVDPHIARDVSTRLARLMGCNFTQIHPTDSFEGVLNLNGLTFFGLSTDSSLDTFFESEADEILSLHGLDKAFEDLFTPGEKAETVGQLVFKIQQEVREH